MHDDAMKKPEPDHAQHHHHHHHHGEHRFSFERIALLDAPDRIARQDPARLVAHLGGRLGETPPARILDVGAGSGTFAFPLLEAFPGATLGALDVEPRMLGVLYGRALERGLSDRLELHEVPPEDTARFPEVSAPFDLIVMVDLYHELDHRPSFLAALRAIAAPGAHLVVCDFAPEGEAEFGPPLEIRIPAEVIQAELSAAGFEEPEAVDLYPGFNTLIARV